MWLRSGGPSEAVAEQRESALMFGFIALLPDDLLELLLRVQDGEDPLAVFAEVTFDSDRVDKEDDDAV